MTNIEIRKKLLLSIQKALLGMIYPSVRVISVKFTELKKLTVFVYLDREPTEFDYENIREVTTEILGDIEFQEIEEQCIYANEPLVNIYDIDKISVYVRQEPLNQDVFARLGS